MEKEEIRSIMQTFLPYADFTRSAQCLDRQRLGKQRLECLQLLNTLFGLTQGWKNHPACRMWRGYEFALTAYVCAVCREWMHRGYKDNVLSSLCDLLPQAFWGTLLKNIDMPPWFGDEAFHASHRSNLLRKDPEHYGKFGWTEASDLPYVWPVPKE